MAIPRVTKLQISPEIPIVGVELAPKFTLSFPDGSTTNSSDVPESSPVNGIYLIYKWSRVKRNQNPVLCDVHESEPANFLSLVSSKYHCSRQCYQETSENNIVPGRKSMMNVYDGSAKDEVGNSRKYTPTNEDAGCVLELKISVVAQTDSRMILGPVRSISTCRVVPYPQPIHRELVSVSGVDVTGQAGSFTVLSYSILSDTSANTPVYSYCPPWARSWEYRKLNLLQEIVSYDGDVVCLQDVQYNHFRDFFMHEMEKHGYDGVYNMKDLNGNTNTGDSTDGCATFFKRHKFSVFLNSNFYFNTAAQDVERLIKNNVAMIVGLQFKFGDQPHKLLCVANTALGVEPEMKDVLIWHVYTLLKKMESIGQRYKEIPIIIAGNFNISPGSAAHTLIVKRTVDPSHPDLTHDPLGIFLPPNKLEHQIPLESTYTSFSKLPPGRHRYSVHFSSNEPWFTVSTKGVKQCQDYIFYTGNTLRVHSLLELPEQSGFLPSGQWSSSHVGLLAQFTHT